MRSPETAITCSSKASASRSTGQKRLMIDRKVRVCQRASGEPRVPTRSGSRWACDPTTRAWPAWVGLGEPDCQVYLTLRLSS